MSRGCPTTKRIALLGVVLLGCASFATELLAQSGQTVNPVPITPPSIQTSTLTCQINCDTQAMNCTNGCLPTTAAQTLGAAAGSPSCNLACSTQQLVCKQRC
jgi:hypothetical protein